MSEKNVKSIRKAIKLFFMQVDPIMPQVFNELDSDHDAMEDWMRRVFLIWSQHPNFQASDYLPSKMGLATPRVILRASPSGEQSGWL